MTLDKLQRHTAYIIILSEVDEVEKLKESCFLCHIIENTFGYYYRDRVVYEKMLPELFSKAPTRTHKSGGWFSEYAYSTRKKIINKCIKETSQT